MGHTSSGVITAPVDVYGDIASVFGIASGDVGDLITRADINKWAKYKPVEVNNPGIISEQERHNANQGFTVSKLHGTTISSVYSLALNNNVDWEYLHNNFTWYRVLDFVPPSLSGNGYNPDAPAPYTFVGGTIANSPDTHAWFEVGFTHNASAEIHHSDLAVCDVSSTENWVYYMLFRKGDASTVYACPIYSTLGGSGLILASTTGSITGYFYTDMDGGISSNVKCCLCIGKISTSSQTPSDYVFLPVQRFVTIDYFSPTAQSSLQWIPYDNTYYSLHIYINQSTGYVNRIEARFNMRVTSWAQVPYANYQLFGYVKNTSAGITMDGSVQFTSNDFTVDTQLNAGWIYKIVTITPPSSQSPITLQDLSNYSMSIRLVAGSSAVWYNPIAPGSDPFGSLTKYDSESSALGTFPDVTSALGSANVRITYV